MREAMSCVRYTADTRYTHEGNQKTRLGGNIVEKSMWWVKVCDVTALASNKTIINI